MTNLNVIIINVKYTESVAWCSVVIKALRY